MPKELYARVLAIAGASFTFTIVFMLLLFVFTGFFLLRAIIAPIFLTVIASFSLLIMTKKRRDILSILKESKQFEKEEK